jgi:hypothetical protein
MILLIKIITVLTFAFLILQMLFTIVPFVWFIVPAWLFVSPFLIVTSIVGLFYYRGNDLLFYANLTVLLAIIPAYYLFGWLLLNDYFRWFIWFFRLWTAILLVFYGLIIFKKLWIL